eukprot:8214153-Pyramimonas_sp.AAC.2
MASGEGRKDGCEEPTRNYNCRSTSNMEEPSKSDRVHSACVHNLRFLQFECQNAAGHRLRCCPC